MNLFFITGNKNKFREVSAMLPGVKQLDIDLPEIQEIDPERIIRAKLEEAARRQSGRFIVEDTSLYLDCLNGLPGPLIKWFIGSIGIAGIADLAGKYGNDRATARTVIGCRGEDGTTKFFTGELPGRITAPRGESNFGFDPIFIPEGHDRTLAELGPEEKNRISMRRRAVNELKKHLK